MLGGIFSAIGGIFSFGSKLLGMISKRNVRQRARNEAVMEGQIEQAERDTEAYRHIADSGKPDDSDADKWVRGRRKADRK